MSEPHFFDKFREHVPLTKERWDEYISYYTRMEVPAKTVLLREGEISQRAFFIEKGALRVWFNNKGKDVTFQFFFENEAVSSAESFRKNIPSIFTIETMEPSVVHWIRKQDMERITKESTVEMKDQLMEAMFERQLHYMHHFLSFIRDTPAQRYQNLLKEKPHIVQRVPLQYIASYLGITPVSLSRIRNKIKNG